jgi:hypothetical protein
MRLPLAAFAALLALCGLAAPAPAQTPGPIHYGDDAGDFANNGECDDPRFEGQGMASIITVADLMHDAADCKAGVEAGRLTYPPLPAYAGDGPAPTIEQIDFGNNESDYADNGACDDPRFGGRLMAEILIASDIRRDAADCRKAVELGEIVFVKDAEYIPDEYSDEDYADEHIYDDSSSTGPAGTNGGRVDLSGIDFGDNESAFALNAECDDRRFRGEAMANILIESDIGHDASDCALAVIDGRASYRRPSDAPIAPGDINFGDDSSNYANNLECDDPRFMGDGMADLLLEDDIGHDASDCSAAMEEGSIEYLGGPA